MLTIRYRTTDGLDVTVQGHPDYPLNEKPGYALATVEALPPRPATGGVLRYQEGALAWYVSPAEGARLVAKAAFAALPLGKQSLWESVRAAVDADLVAGNVAAAVLRIQTVPAIYPDIEADRAVFLALFVQ